MKKLIPVILIVIAITGQVFAIDGEKKSESSNMKVETLKERKIIKLFYDADDATNQVVVKIYNNEGDIVYSEKIHKKDAFVRPYNLSNLSGNDFTIEVTDGSNIYDETICFAEEINTNMFRKAFIAPIKGEKGKYQLIMANNADNQVTINIYGDNELLFKSSEDIEAQFSKIYDLSKYNSKDIKFEIMDRFGAVETVTF